MKSEEIYQIIFSVLDNEATEEERFLFSEWLKASEANQMAYERLKSLHQEMVRTPKAKIYDVEQAWQNINQRIEAKEQTLWFPVWARYAAMAAIIVSIGIFFSLKGHHAPVISEVNMEEFLEPTLLLDNGERIALTEESFAIEENYVVIKNDAENQLVYESKEEVDEEVIQSNRLVIPKGRTYQLLLADGTRIWLNSETELVYPTQFIDGKREVTLVGEAFFEVAKDKDKPFVVKANGVDVEVLGTSFNISCYTVDETTSTTLVEGSVTITPPDGETREITPSEQFIYNRKNNSTDVQVVNTELFTSWINGKYIFKKTKLEDIFNKLQRWYDFSVEYEEESIKNCRYSIEVDRNTDIDQFLEVISHTSKIKLERINQTIYVKKEKEECI